MASAPDLSRPRSSRLLRSQDTEDYDFIEFSVVVKLTADGAGEPPSQMRVVGARRYFDYGARSGASGSFRARVHHASVTPQPEAQQHLKLAFFFRASVQGERRAKRALTDVAADTAEGELARRRRVVAQDLNNFSFAAQALRGSQTS